MYFYKLANILITQKGINMKIKYLIPILKSLTPSYMFISVPSCEF